MNSDTYDAQVWCRNCHAAYQITIQRGTRVSNAVIDLSCDICGCDTLVKYPDS